MNENERNFLSKLRLSRIQAQWNRISQSDAKIQNRNLQQFNHFVYEDFFLFLVFRRVHRK